MTTEFPRYRINVSRPSGVYDWRLDLQRQERRFGRWALLTSSGGKSMKEALTALAYGAGKYPELAA